MGAVAESEPLSTLGNRIACRVKAICQTAQKGLSPDEAKEVFQRSGVGLSEEEEKTVRMAVEKLNA